MIPILVMGGLRLRLVEVALDVALLLLVLVDLVVGVGIVLVLSLVLRQTAVHPASIRVILVSILGHLIATEGLLAVSHYCRLCAGTVLGWSSGVSGRELLFLSLAVEFALVDIGTVRSTDETAIFPPLGLRVLVFQALFHLLSLVLKLSAALIGVAAAQGILALEKPHLVLFLRY